MDPDRLGVRFFQSSPAVSAFSCGDEALDKFLTTDEVIAFEEAGLGRTYLAFYQGTLVAYFTLSNDSLRIEYLRTVKPFSRPVDEDVDVFPAVKVGRLAVATEWQNRGVGRHLISHIVSEALQQGQRSGVRLLLLEALPASAPFYLKCGFTLTKETRRERGKRNRTMFIDLRPLDDLTP